MTTIKKKLNKLKKIYQILEGEDDIDQENIIPKDLTPNDLKLFKFAPITSVNAERSFSIFSIIKTCWQSTLNHLNFQNIKKALIIQCNINVIWNNLIFFLYL